MIVHKDLVEALHKDLGAKLSEYLEKKKSRNTVIRKENKNMKATKKKAPAKKPAPKAKAKKK